MNTEDLKKDWTEPQLQMLLGTLLGDGHLKRSGRITKQTAIYISQHGWCQHKYNVTKHQALPEHETHQPGKKKNLGYGDWSSVWYTKALTKLHALYSLTYPDGHKKVTPEWLNLITAEEAANRLNVHHKTISRLLRKEKIAGVKLANRWLLDESALISFSQYYTGSKGRPKGYSPGRRRKK